MKNYYIIWTFRILFCLIILFFNYTLKSQELSSESAKSIELLKSAWSFLDSNSIKLYPNWNNYRLYPVFIGLPNKQGTFINPNKELPQGFLQIKTDTILKIFVRDSSNVKYGGSAVGVKIDDIYYPRYLKLSIYNSEFNDDYISYIRKYFRIDHLPDSVVSLIKSSEYFISIVIHEAFHIFQQKSKRLQPTKDINYLRPKIAALSYIEGCLLSEALKSNSDELTKELVAKFISVRKYKNRSLVRWQINWEEDYEWLEGAAMYIQTEALKKLLSDSQKRCLSYLDSMNLRSSIINMNEPGNKDYYYGLTQAYLLDRLYGPSWKIKIISDNVHFIDLFKEVINYDEKYQKQYLQQILNKYQFNLMKKKLKTQFKQGNYIIEIK